LGQHLDFLANVSGKLPKCRKISTNLVTLPTEKKEKKRALSFIAAKYGKDLRLQLEVSHTANKPLAKENLERHRRMLR
jgi:hypothetical protein